MGMHFLDCQLCAVHSKSVPLPNLHFVLEDDILFNLTILRHIKMVAGLICHFHRLLIIYKITLLQTGLFINLPGR